MTWSAPTRVSPAGQAAFTPSVHVRANGDVGVTYYDFRNNTAAAGLPTDYWLARSSDGGVSWTETHVATAFDLTNAPQAGGAYFLGDYQALGSRNNVFVPFFVKTSNGDLTNRTDVYAAPAVSVTAASTQMTLQSLIAHPLERTGNRRVPRNFRVTDALRARVDAQAERSMRWRVSGWGDRTMRSSPLPQ